MAWHYDQQRYVDIKETKCTTKCIDLVQIPCKENESYPKTHNQYSFHLKKTTRKTWFMSSHMMQNAHQEREKNSPRKCL